MSARKLRVAMVYGEFSSAIHGPFDFAKLGDAALTGSESSFFNLARSLAEKGHEVVVFAPASGAYEHPSGAAMLPLSMLPGISQMRGVDAVVAWNEPDYLRYAPPGALRVVDQQLNDWGYCRPGWEKVVDCFVFPSKSSMGNHLPQIQGSSTRKFDELRVIPNSVDLDLFEDCAQCVYGLEACPTHQGALRKPERHPHRVVYSSSPDRGLHHLLSFWPEVRRRVPDAELKIFYRLEPWLQRARDLGDEVGRRARYVEEALRVLTAGEWGVQVVGPVPNREMARQLRQAAVLAYPCDPVRYTEGFGVSVLDACAAGCLPIISDADALNEVHGYPAICIQGSPSNNRRTWIGAIVSYLNPHQPKPEGPAGEDLAAAHAAEHDRLKVAEKWVNLIEEATKR